MRIGLYGMPAAGKTYILERIDFMEAVSGSRLLREYDPDFHMRDEAGQEWDRRGIAAMMMEKETFIMDGHYAFGGQKVFTEADGRMYDVVLYLYIAPAVLWERMSASGKNRRYLKFDIAEWQDREISGLRDYCHEHNKDFYVIDNPPDFIFGDVSGIIRFIKAVTEGYSCFSFAKKCAEAILGQSKTDTVTLFDGDKTLTTEDSSHAVFGYVTHIYDGNFYTGYQAWRQDEEFRQYTVPEGKGMPVRLNEQVCKAAVSDAYILTSGHEKVWGRLSKELNIPFFCGAEMSADTKFYITKLLQNAGKKVTAYGDGMNDYFMLKQADRGYLVRKRDGTLSGSLKGRNLEGINFV